MWCILGFSAFLLSFQHSNCCKSCKSVNMAARLLLVACHFMASVALGSSSLPDRDKVFMPGLIGGFWCRCKSCTHSMSNGFTSDGGSSPDSALRRQLPFLTSSCKFGCSCLGYQPHQGLNWNEVMMLAIDCPLQKVGYHWKSFVTYWKWTDIFLLRNLVYKKPHGGSEQCIWHVVGNSYTSLTWFPSIRPAQRGQPTFNFVILCSSPCKLYLQIFAAYNHWVRLQTVPMLCDVLDCPFHCVVS